MILLHDAWRWGLPADEVEPLLPHLDAALGYHSLYAKVLTNEEKKPPFFFAGDPVTMKFLVQECSLNFWIDFQAGYSQGIFLDQRLNRQRLR